MCRRSGRGERGVHGAEGRTGVDEAVGRMGGRADEGGKGADSLMEKQTASSSTNATRTTRLFSLSIGETSLWVSSPRDYMPLLYRGARLLFVTEYCP